MRWICVSLLFCTGCVSLTFRGNVVDTTVHFNYNWEQNEFTIRPEIEYNERFRKEFNIDAQSNIAAVY